MTEYWDLDWPRAHGGTAITAEFRREPEDFVVEEQGDPVLTDTGEHVYLQVRKRGANTSWVAQQLARVAGVSPRDVGFFGLKDRHAVTTQWFSVWLAQRPEPDWTAIVSEEVEILRCSRGQRKLRRGEHTGNRFQIRLRDTRGDRDRAEQLLASLAGGVPNYFGEQRFGRDGGNLTLARRLAEEGGRARRSERTFAMSAARSWLFNQVLGQRVKDGSWRELLDGEPQPYPSAPLWGRGRNPATRVQAGLEAAAVAPWQPWCDWLEHCGLKQERRALVLQPGDLEHEWHGDDLQLAFSLPVGTFATAVLRELAELANAAAGAIK
ncbi:tRNA pseudouridine(13) synthase TruD [Microbulbifer yueqingensis]|uniref:tRNA pseudouridine synthase D n=1 Tax=Microbulbifer yueqingensis TaxID=658219 RepID=A0A1G9E4P8_9GAMM|nr:tRNA pseudouridine(13) synthase TruD [Microbulbifer yueqingensis]SDK71126.1 tRNA pseudouridine13 synthase [Microbulbifer yueqingensis]